MKYNPKIVLAYFHACGLPDPMVEYRFDVVRKAGDAVRVWRKWRFDFAWPAQHVALEVQGGLFTRGAHVRGAALVKEHEKLNHAASFGWRILYCQPRDVSTLDMIKLIKLALER